MSNVKLTDGVRAQILALVKSGTHPNVACAASGLHEGYLRQLRFDARRGKREEERSLIDEIAQAQAQAESNDVVMTKRAASLEKLSVTCPSCSAPFQADPAAMASLIGAAESAQRIKASAASVAMQRLERRFPERWSQKVIHTVQEEHDRLLNVAQRVLSAEVFELLLEEYLAGDGGEGAPGGSEGGEASGGVH